MTALLLRGIQYLRFRSLRPVLGGALLAVGNAGCIQRAANHVITNARKILDAAAANQHDRVLLQVVADTGDVRGHFDSIGESHARHFPERRIRLLRSGGVHTGTYTALLRTALKGRTRSLPAWRFPPITDKLIKRWHEFPLREVFNYVEQPTWSNPHTTRIHQRNNF